MNLFALYEPLVSIMDFPARRVLLAHEFTHDIICFDIKYAAVKLFSEPWSSLPLSFFLVVVYLRFFLGLKLNSFGVLRHIDTFDAACSAVWAVDRQSTASKNLRKNTKQQDVGSD